MWSSFIQWDFFACAEGLGKDSDGKNLLSVGYSQYSKRKAIPDLGHKTNFFIFLLMWSIGGWNDVLYFLYVAQAFQTSKKILEIVYGSFTSILSALILF